jgi:hypothetical protein
MLGMLSAASIYLEGQVPEANRLVSLNKIEIQGSRLSEAGVIQLSGLAVGQQVNDLVVNNACHKITASGLVKKVDYGYDVYPDKPGVSLVLTLVDEAPLFPSTITPASESELIWGALLQSNPLLKRELPRTEAALKFYAVQIESILKQRGRDNEYVAPLVAADAAGSPTGIVFAIRTYKQTRAGGK